MFVLAYVLFLSLFVSCKKDKDSLGLAEERTQGQLLKDSVYYYYNLYSLWSDEYIPDYEKPSVFTDQYALPENVLDALKGMTPFYANYNGSIDRFSYLEEIGQEGYQPALRMDANTGFGLFLSIGAVSADMAYPVVYFVEGGSPAARAGIRRSDVLLAIDEWQSLGIPVSCGSGGCTIRDEQGYQRVINVLLEAMERNSIRIRCRHVDESESEFTMVSRYYEIDPIIKDTIFSHPQKNIGYLAMSSFEEISEGHTNRHRLDEVFESFERQQIHDLILDIRYNTGGYVRTAEYLANKIISAAAHKSLMYKYMLNAHLALHPHFEGGSFDDVYFQRDNTLDLQTIYFLVTDMTASASELLISVLRPYMNVVVIAERGGTYGKPVGFFQKNIMGKIALWAASFKMVNANNETDYWNGIGADKRNVTDYIFRDFGDEEEVMLSTAISDALGRQAPTGLMSRNRIVSPPMHGRISTIHAIPRKPLLK